MFPLCALRNVWPFKKKDLSITFFSLTPQLEIAYPIYPAKDLPMPWIKESQQAATVRQSTYSRGRNHGAAHKCSGIMSLVNKGWILPAWHDFAIETNGDRTTMKIHLPSPAPVSMLNGIAPVGTFDTHHYGDFPSSPLPQTTHKKIVKVHMPWGFRITPGWGLMMLPLEYTKEPRFTSAAGIINPRITPQMNPILYWHVLNGTTLIKAGTPLCRLVPIPIDDKWTMHQRPATPEEIEYQKAHGAFFSCKWTDFHSVVGRLYDHLNRRSEP